MQDKLIQHVRNAFISFAIGFILSGSIGCLYPINRYFFFGSNGRSEVPLDEYKSYPNDPLYLKDTKFNMDIAFPTGLVSCGISFLLLTGIGSIKKVKFRSTAP